MSQHSHRDETTVTKHCNRTVTTVSQQCSTYSIVAGLLQYAIIDNVPGVLTGDAVQNFKLKSFEEAREQRQYITNVQPGDVTTVSQHCLRFAGTRLVTALSVVTRVSGRNNGVTEMCL